VSENLINSLVEFRIGSEVISSHIPLLIVIENILQRNVNKGSSVEKTTHKLVKYM
jgi:hypothetical protein